MCSQYLQFSGKATDQPEPSLKLYWYPPCPGTRKGVAVQR